MIANPTTLILGAGASRPAYPTGDELRDRIINACAGESDAKARALGSRLQRSLIPSIDAFLAEPENKDLEEVGKIMIAEALLPGESKAHPIWYRLLFNAIRSRAKGAKLRVVTFNYDLSLEDAIYKAFIAAYRLDGGPARVMMDEAIEIIHVYGQLGEIAMPRGQRTYGESNPSILETARGLRIIGRAPDNPQFTKAHEAIASAKFLGILGFGFDETNIANLKLVELSQDKAVFSTAYGMGYGMRAWIRHIGLKKILFGHREHHVEKFLESSGFLHWANVPGLTGHAMQGAISEHLGAVKFELPD